MLESCHSYRAADFVRKVTNQAQWLSGYFCYHPAWKIG